MVKRWLWIIVPLAVLLGLVGWRLKVRGQEEAAFAPGGGAPPAGGRPAGGPGGTGGGKGGPGGGMGGSRTPTVQVATASPAVILDAITSVGNVVSPTVVQLSPKASDRIEFLEAREGDAVTPGQVLVRLDSSDEQAAVYQAEANVAEARSRLAQAQLQQNPTAVGVQGQIAQQRAGYQSAQASLNQVSRNYDAQVAAAQATVTDATAKVAAAQAQVKNAQATLNQQTASFANATTKFGRTENLYKQGFIAAQDVDDARTAMQVAQGQVEVAKGGVAAAQQAVASAQAQRDASEQQLAIVRRKGVADIAAARAQTTQAQAGLNVARANTAQNPAYRQNLAALQAAVQAAVGQLQSAQSRLADTVLRSPIKGTVTARNDDPGSLASPSQAILTLQFIDWLYVTSSIPIEQSGLIHQGQTAVLTFDAMPGRQFTGTISGVNAAADPQSRQFGVRIKLPNPGHVLRPGMFAHVDIVTNRVQAKIAVPREAVETDKQGATTIAVVGDDHKAQVRPVTLGVQDSQNVQVLSGIDAGEKVVILSYQPVRDGQEVRLPTPPGASGRKGGREGAKR